MKEPRLGSQAVRNVNRVPLASGEIALETITDWVGTCRPLGIEVLCHTKKFVLDLQCGGEDINVERFHVAPMHPDGAHDHVGFDLSVVRQGVRRSPDMMRQVGGAVDEVIGEEKRYGVEENRRDRNGDEQCRNDMAGGITSVTSEDSAERMSWREDRRLGRTTGWSIDITRRLRKVPVQLTL